MGAVDGTRVLHGLLPALTEGGTDCVRAEEEGRALLARICKDKLSPDLRARLAVAGLNLRENPRGWAFGLGKGGGENIQTQYLPSSTQPGMVGILATFQDWNVIEDSQGPGLQHPTPCSSLLAPPASAWGLGTAALPWADVCQVGRHYREDMLR